MVESTTLNVMICSGESDHLGHILAEELKKRGIEVTLLIHPNHADNTEVKRLVDQVGCKFIDGDAMEEAPDKLADKMEGNNIIVSAAFLNSIYHPLIQYKTDMNLFEACKIYKSRRQSAFKAFVPCQWTLDFTLSYKDFKQDNISWSWIDCKKAIINKLRTDNEGVTYMAFFGGLPVDYLSQCCINKQSQCISFYGSIDSQFDCTTVRDLANVAAKNIAEVNRHVPFHNKEVIFRGQRTSIQQVAQQLNYASKRLGSSEECWTNLRMKPKDLDSRNELVSLLFLYLIGSNSGKLENQSQIIPTYEKEFKFESLQNFVNSNSFISNPIQ